MRPHKNTHSSSSSRLCDGIPSDRPNSHPLLRQNIHQQWTWSPFPLGLEDSLILLEFLHAVEVGVEEIGGVERTAFGFGVKLGAEYWAGLMDHSWFSSELAFAGWESSGGER